MTESTSPAVKNLQLHPHNDDLLVNDAFRSDVQQTFPKIFHVFNFPEMRAAFKPLEVEAVKARKCLFRIGILSVIAATVLIWLSSSEWLWASHETAKRLFALPLEIGSLIVATIGGGLILTGSLRTRWLRSRMAAELIRQWHFQFILFHADLIEASFGEPSEEQQKTFFSKRLHLFKVFLLELNGNKDSLLTRTVGSEETDFLWSSAPPSKHKPSVYSNEHIEDISEAYNLLRIRYQSNYANHKLRDSTMQPFWKFLSWPSVVQRARIEKTSYAVLGIAVLMAIANVVCNLLSLSENTDHSALASISQVVLTGTSTCLFLGLALGAIAKGLGLDQEIERYRHYDHLLKIAAEKFDSSSAGTAKRDGMILTETAAVDELCRFLKLHHANSWAMG